MDNTFGALLALLGGFIIVAVIIAIAFYVLQALALVKMATNLNIENPWIAWIPIGNLYIIGMIIKTIDFGEKRIEKAELIIPAAALLAGILGAIPVIGFLIVIANMVILLVSLFKLYKMYKPGSEVLYIVLTIIFTGIAMPIILFINKDNTPIEV